eukprot:4877221-Amphidinium_carterae.1
MQYLVLNGSVIESEERVWDQIDDLLAKTILYDKHNKALRSEADARITYGLIPFKPREKSCTSVMPLLP